MFVTRIIGHGAYQLATSPRRCCEVVSIIIMFSVVLPIQVSSYWYKTMMRLLFSFLFSLNFFIYFLFFIFYFCGVHAATNCCCAFCVAVRVIKLVSYIH